MTTLSKSLMALGLAALMTAPASAQQRGGGGMGRGMGVAMLLSNASVQEELKLDDSQKSKLGDIAEKAREKYRSGTEGLEGQERMAKMRELSKEVDGHAIKAAAEVLKPEQVARLHEIRYQVAGPAAFETEDLQKKLSITSEQKSAIDSIVSTSNTEMRELFQAGGGGGDREAMMAKMRDHRKATVAKIEAKLTADQKAEYAKLLGSPFEIKMEGRGPGR
ncbi:hypothetical protein [Paludisphaera mucosa]|uniref:Periplasmic repressor CpxP n=1 Tax=Paludisphaera mucosa TaxID=3030827 RepID=A0ABT6FG10_9BACT|nr:hypothetical protein [Paludisphaera mucosa]MDG3006510.1 hypothetical protein [Paludisphaera mucosa]